MVYILDQVVYQAVPIINATHNIHFAMRQTYDLSQWTVEMNVNMSKLGPALGELNHQTLKHVEHQDYTKSLFPRDET